jgi:RNA polymerase sigma-70 factor (ECF subfamily)
MQLEKKYIKQCANGNRRAINKLYDMLFSYLMNICMRYKKNYDDAGASVNAIFLKVVQNMEEMDSERSILPFVKTIAVRFLVDEYRASKRLKANVIDMNADINYQAKSSDFADEDVISRDILKWVHDLPEPCGTIFNLFAIDGYKHKEIAEILDMTESNSKWHLNKARNILKDKIFAEKQRLNLIGVNNG